MIDAAAFSSCPHCHSDVSDARMAGDRIDRLASAISHARVKRHARSNTAFATFPRSRDGEQLDYRKCFACGAVCDAAATELHALTVAGAAAKIAVLRRMLAREISRGKSTDRVPLRA